MVAVRHPELAQIPGGATGKVHGFIFLDALVVGSPPYGEHHEFGSGASARAVVGGATVFAPAFVAPDAASLAAAAFATAAVVPGNGVAPLTFGSTTHGATPGGSGASPLADVTGAIPCDRSYLAFCATFFFFGTGAE